MTTGATRERSRRARPVRGAPDGTPARRRGARRPGTTRVSEPAAPPAGGDTALPWGYRMRHDSATAREAGPTLITTHLDRQPADFADVRATNLAVVLAHVRSAAPCSRADIAVATGLNKATVSSLVSELIGRRLLRETGLTERRIGRPATMIVLDGAPYAAIGLSLGPDELHLLAVDLSGQQLLSWHRAVRGGAPSSVLAAVAAAVKRAQAR